MFSKLVQKLQFSLEPVAIYFTDEKPVDTLQFEEGKRGCVASMLLASAKGRTAVFDENTYGCPGGGAGLCMGNTFEKNNHPVECLLSTGDEALAETGRTYTRSFGRGERFFASPEVAGKWKSEFPYAETGKTFVVFRPLSSVDKNSPPDIISIFANPDQLSALVTMAGFNRGDAISTIVPFGAACHSIAYAYREMAEERAKAVLGFFDISQRHSIPRELLSFTLPFSFFMEMDDSVDESCLTTEPWERISERF